MKKLFCVTLSFLMAISTNIYAYAAYDFDKSSVQNIGVQGVQTR